MTEPAEIAHDVLGRVAAFLRTLPADQLADLASGAAKLELVPRGGRPAPKARDELPRPAEEIVNTMVQIGDRAAARRYLETDLKLTGPKLLRLAADVGITVPKSPKARTLDAVVEWAIGRRLTAEAISRAGAGP